MMDIKDLEEAIEWINTENKSACAVVYQTLPSQRVEVIKEALYLAKTVLRGEDELTLVYMKGFQDAKDHYTKGKKK